MKKLLSSFAAAGLLLLAAQLQAQNFGKNLVFSAKPEGSQQVPAVVTPANGLGVITLNAGKDTLFVNIAWEQLSSKLTGIHFHNGKKGANGPVVIDLMPYLNGS